MKIDLNKTVSMLIILIGHAFFFLNAVSHFAIACIGIIAMFLIWMIWQKANHNFILNDLLYLITFSGILVSLSIFIIFGIEPIGTRNGTLIRFNSTAIALALGTCLVTILPYIIFALKFSNQPIKIQFSKKQQAPTSKVDQYIVDDETWEIASEADLLSSQYHIE
tara:strand:+ start:2770 stop:3264 length:495 start_codon:yes stop_codon:yes gene_type:complete